MGMVMPDPGSAPDGTWAQVLIKLGEMAVDIGQVRARLDEWAAIPERLRQVELSLAENRGGRDSLSRALAIAGVILALAAAAAAWVAVARRLPGQLAAYVLGVGGRDCLV